MSKLVFLSNPSTIYEGTLSKVNENIIRLVFTENIPDEKELLSGLNIINEHNGKVMSSRTGYGTVYRTYEDNPLMVELSNDTSVWVKPLAKVRFNVYNGGKLEGDTLQEVYNFEDLKVPTITVDEGFEFIKWTPEIPTEGLIEKDMSFAAIIKDNNIYFHSSGGGCLDGELKQLVDNYNQLTIPTPIPDENYKFVGWMPEIPTEGEVETTNFYAVFENNIPDRLKFVEDDLTNTQLGLVENYDLTLASAQEITDCQLALVELYDLFLSQIAE